jgi:hypothetical protein
LVALEAFVFLRWIFFGPAPSLHDLQTGLGILIKLLRVSRPENECVESNYFEFEFRGKKTNNKYENWMSQVEGNAAAILERINAAAHPQSPRTRDTDNVRCGPFWAAQKSKSANFKCDVPGGPGADRLLCLVAGPGFEPGTFGL